MLCLIEAPGEASQGGNDILLERIDGFADRGIVKRIGKFDRFCRRRRLRSGDRPGCNGTVLGAQPAPDPFAKHQPIPDSAKSNLYGRAMLTKLLPKPRLAQTRGRKRAGPCAGSGIRRPGPAWTQCEAAAKAL